MKLSIVEVDENEIEEIVIKCHKVDETIMDLVRKIKVTKDKISGMNQDKIYSIPIDNVYYYETVDNKGFFYTKDQVFETKMKLFQFEQDYGGEKFFRASKSVILNVTKIAYMKPSFSGRFEATLNNQEKVIISRQYVVELKKLLGV